MESRVRKLEDRFAPPEKIQLRAMATIAAEGTTLDPDAIVQEATAVLARMRAAGPRTLEEIAADEEIAESELRPLMTTLRDRWQEIA